MIIREYKNEDEKGWVRCRVLSFLDTSYYDDVMRHKEVYDNPSLCVVAEEEGKIIGILDAEYENKPGEVCLFKGGLGAMIWTLAVVPEYQRMSVATKMFEYVKKRLIEKKIKHIEVWTQDDEKSNKWYVKQGFIRKNTYLNAFIKGMYDDPVIKKYINTDYIGKSQVRCLNFEASINEKEELEKVSYRLHEVRGYDLQL